MNDIPLVGIDLGYGQVKVAGPGFRSSFPAVVADASVASEPTGLVVIAGRRFLVGEPALADPSHRYASRLDKIHTPDEIARYCVALATTADHYDCSTLNVCTGLPPAQWRDEAYKRQVQEKLTGEFCFTYQDKPYRIEVPGVTVDPQAGAAFYDFLLHDDGEIADRRLLQMQTLVLDIGHNTTDVAMFSGRKAAFGRDSLKTVMRGVWHVHEELQRLIQKEFRLPLSAARIDPIWRQGGLNLGGQWTSIENLKPIATAPIAAAITAEVERAAGDIRLWDAVLLTGGGAQVLGEHLNLVVPLHVASNPAFGNATGYFKRQMERLRTRGA